MRLNTITILLVITSIITSSCKKDVENKYSCNNDINNFVSENKEELAVLSYNEILSYDIENQKAIFRLMSPNKRFEMWEGKLSWVISEGFLSEDQKQQVQNLLSSLNQSWFDENFLAIEENSTLIEDYFTSWITASINDHGFNETMLFSTITRLDKYDNQYNNFSSGENKIEEDANNDLKTDGSGTCGCSTTSDWCDSSMGGSLGHCGQSNCISSTLGCGTLWTYTCDGDCVLGPNPGDM